MYLYTHRTDNEVTTFIFGARTINDRAVKKLDAEKKVELIDLFSGSRSWNFLLLLVIIGLFFLVLRFDLLDPVISIVLYIVALVAYMVFFGKISYDKLKKNDFPADFIRSYIISVSIRLVGIVVFMAFLIN